MIELDTLEAAAKAATPGPWKSDLRVGIAAIYTAENNPNCLSNVPDHDRICAINGVYADGRWNMTEQQEANAAFIAAANPAVVLELVAELRKARAERDWLTEQIGGNLPCPPYSDVIDEADCDNECCEECWLKAASKAVEKEVQE